MRRKKRGFSLAEVLVSIAVLTISITGVLAALAYDAFSSEQSGSYTYALNYTRRMLDLMQSGQILPDSVTSATVPAAIDSNAFNDGTNWRDLDAGLLNGGGAIDLWGAPGSVERKRFDNEKQKFGVNIALSRVVANKGLVPTADKYKNQLVEVVVTTRWRQKKGFRSVRLRGFYATAANS